MNAMSDKAKTNLQMFGLLVAVSTGITGLFGAFVILPYKVEAIEQQVKSNAEKTATDHELLVRIEERLITVQKQIERLP